MKKYAIAIFAALWLCVLSLSACGDDPILAKPEDTALEFWITEKVSREDFQEHYCFEGVFGGLIYLGKDYPPPETAEDHSLIFPEHYVQYTVTAYPDYSSNKGIFDTVTKIQITDPDVSVYGITCNSSLEEFDKVFTNLGCSIQDKGILHIAKSGKTHISFAKYEEREIITIWVEVTNKQGIDF